MYLPQTAFTAPHLVQQSYLQIIVVKDRCFTTYFTQASIVRSGQEDDTHPQCKSQLERRKVPFEQRKTPL